jgi:hypothetical protein
MGMQYSRKIQIVESGLCESERSEAARSNKVAWTSDRPKFELNGWSGGTGFQPKTPDFGGKHRLLARIFPTPILHKNQTQITDFRHKTPDFQPTGGGEIAIACLRVLARTGREELYAPVH